MKGTILYQVLSHNIWSNSLVRVRVWVGVRVRVEAEAGGGPQADGLPGPINLASDTVQDKKQSQYCMLCHL